MGRIVGIVVAVAAAGIAAIVLLGAGKDRIEPRKPAPPPVAQASAPGPPAGPPARVGATVRMHALLFQSPVVHVHAGEAVQWVNGDSIDHTVVQDIGPGGAPTPLFASARIGPGKSYRFVFRTPGTVAFICTLHPTIMTGHVVVSPA